LPFIITQVIKFEYSCFNAGKKTSVRKILDKIYSNLNSVDLLKVPES